VTERTDELVNVRYMVDDVEEAVAFYRAIARNRFGADQGQNIYCLAFPPPNAPPGS
jgi:catechol 2,3-dioxygenase-like lactoylglutathione lyase family enzyme